VKGPEPYLNDFQIQLPCCVDSTQLAILDPEHRAFVNHEVYFFSSDAARDQFNAEPYRYTGLVTDPVSLSRFQPTSASQHRSAAGRLFYFESDSTLARFDDDPGQYSTPKPSMQEVR
jgi:YHS domain-containing protein